MDIYINTSMSIMSNTFKKLNFEVQNNGKYHAATLRKNGGRYHAVYTKFNGGVYCDFHFDKNLHYLFFGVDYRKRPKFFFENVLKSTLESKAIPFKIKHANWFTRRNRALFAGMKL